MFSLHSIIQRIATRGLVLLAVLLTMNWAVAGRAQTTSADKRFSVDIQRARFSDAIKTIEDKTGYAFVYESKDVDLNARVTMSASGATIHELVQKLLAGTRLRATITGKYVVLKRQDDVSPSATSADDNKRVQQSKPANERRRVVTGRVRDAAGEPMIGATIKVAGTNIVTVTDMDGNYAIEMPANKPEANIEVSYVGYDNIEQSTQGRDNVDVIMLENVTVLGNVVVIGYGTQRKESLTSAISVVTADDIARSSATNTSGAIVGKVAGINSRMSDGRPGAWTTLNIRNMGTPLYVVDGVQMEEGQFNNIDFNDIESISVLKDASAAIYGVRAANGVVVVTTKSGKRNQKNTINLNMYYGTQRLFRFPQPANAATYVRSAIQSTTLGFATNPTYAADELPLWQAGTEPGYQGFNWADYIFTSAPQFYLSANMTGGSDRINYYIALSHLKQESIIRNYGDFHRTNIQLNLDANVTDRFKLGVSMNGRVQNTVHPGVPMDDDYWTAMFSVYANRPTVRPFANDNPLYPAVTSEAGYTNFAVLDFAHGGKNEDRWKVLQATFHADYEPIKNLKFKGIFSYYYANERMDNQEYTYNLYRYDPINDEYVIANQSSGSGFKERRYAEVTEINGQLSGNYKADIGQSHINLFAGWECYKRDAPSMYMRGNPTSNALHLFYYNITNGISDVGNNTQARLGWMGRANYDYAGRYLLELSARYDGSWKFPKNHRWGFFPAVSAGWRIGEEAFFESLKPTFSNLKIRASYGATGDDNVSGYNAFDYLEGYNYNATGAVIDGAYVIGAQARALAVTNLSWIKAKTLDVGVDFGFFNNRLTGAFDFFVRKRTGLPAARYDKLLPSEVGFTLPYENLESDLQRGFDGELYYNGKAGDLTYRVGGNFTLSRKYYWEQYNPRYNNSRHYYVYNRHHRVQGASWGYTCLGQFQSWEQIANYPVDIDGQGNKTMRPGDLIYADLNGDGIITDEDQHAIGYQAYESNIPPILSYAINLQAQWRGIDVAADFTGAGMQTFWFNFEQRGPFHNTNPQYMMSDQWSLADPSDPSSELIPGTYPTLLYGNESHINYREGSTFWMRNVKYCKLRNLEVGYTLPERWLKKVGVKKLRVYTLMQNLFSIDNVHDREIDPEISTASGVNYPTNRIINFGINATF